MKKRIIILSALLCMLFIVNVYAATYTTSRQGSSQGYRVTARAYWVYETGKYSSKGPLLYISIKGELGWTKNGRYL